MQPAEIEAIGRLSGDALSAGGELVAKLHAAVAERAFRSSPASAPARVLHDAISRAVYSGVRSGLRGVARGGAAMAALRVVPGVPAAEDSRGAIALGALSGIWGDRIAQEAPELTPSLAVHHRGRPVHVETESLRAAFPAATPRVAVFVHGLCETELAWSMFSAPADPERRPYGERLREDLGYTPVYLRYNTGLHISENGRRLARLLEDLAATWPCTVEEIVLVGHSMGGLVARSACHYAHADGLAVTDAIRHVFCLGTPHLGADLEKGANVLTWALRRVPETRGLADLLGARSVGIKDLRYGSCVEEDWCDCDPDEFLRDRCREVPFLPRAAYYFVGATLSPAPVGRLLGDLLVRMPSSSGRGSGRGRRIAFEVENGHELPGVNHFQLLGHPAVYRQLHIWLTRGGGHLAAPAPVALLPAGS